MPNIHYKYGGSTAGRTIQCPAWHELTAQLPKRPSGSSPDADRGTLLHDCMEELLLKPDLAPQDFLGRKYNDQVVTQDDIDDALIPALNAYLDFADENDILIEMPEVEVKYADEVGGTSDIICANDDTVFIIDWKFGYNPVSPEENPQGLFYSMCARKDKFTAPLFKDRERVCVVIIQPQSNPVLQSWSFTMERLDVFEVDHLNAVDNQNIDIAIRGDYCKFCPAMAVCPAKNGQALQALKVDPNTKQKLTDALKMADDVIEWAQSVKKMAHEQMELGVKLDGFKLVDKRATRKWNSDEDILAVLKKARSLKMDDFLDQKLKSPAQLEKVCKKKGVDFDKYASYSSSVSSGTTLATADDKRPEAFNVANFNAAIAQTD